MIQPLERRNGRPSADVDENALALDLLLVHADAVGRRESGGAPIEAQVLPVRNFFLHARPPLVDDAVLAGDYAGQIAAVQSRFKQIRDGVWVERGEGGFAIKLDILCQAINEFQKETGKPLTDVATLMQRLEEEDGFKEKVRKVPGVSAHYSRLAGRSTATLDDLGL